MAYSIIRGMGDGVTTTFPINFALGYLSREDVQFRVLGEEDGLGNPVYRDLTWLNDGLVQISGSPPSTSQEYWITRTVSKSELQHNYEDGEIINEVNLNETALQSIMAIHEVLDGRFETGLQTDLDLGGYRIVNLGDAVDLTDAVTLQQLQDMTGNAPYWAGVAQAAAAEALGYRDETQVLRDDTEDLYEDTLDVLLNTEGVLDDFLTKYLGAFSTPPSTDLEGNPLIVGALYWSTVSQSFRAWDGAAWADPLIPDASVTVAKLAPQAGNTVLGRQGTTGGPAALNMATLRTMLGLLSAAFLDAGTAAGNLPILDADGRIVRNQQVPIRGGVVALSGQAFVDVTLPAGCTTVDLKVYAGNTADAQIHVLAIDSLGDVRDTGYTSALLSGGSAASLTSGFLIRNGAGASFSGGVQVSCSGPIIVCSSSGMYNANNGNSGGGHLFLGAGRTLAAIRIMPSGGGTFNAGQVFADFY